MSDLSDLTVLEAFHTDHTLKAIKKHYHMAPTTIRDLWRKEYGEEAVAGRGKRVRKAKASEWSSKPKEKPLVYSEITITCSICSGTYEVLSNRVPKTKEPVCPTCAGQKFDRECPVCGLGVDGARGLSGHFRHQREKGDEAHIDYQLDQEDQKWADKIEGVDYVKCAVPGCGHRAVTLARHLKATHGFTADVYRQTYGADLPIRSEALTAKRSAKIKAARQEYGTGKGGKKIITCPDCGQDHEVSKFLGEGTHETRCLVCRLKNDAAIETQKWVGKLEPDDFVTCQVCSYRAENLTSHIQSMHPGLLDKYTNVFPGCLLMSLGCASRDKESIRANLTATDLDEFADEKGRIIVALAANELGYSQFTIRRYCESLGLETRNKLAFQKEVLDRVSLILQAEYEWEWRHPEITNPKTGYTLFFDGYYPDHNLIVEVHGKQHWEFVPCWHKTQEKFEYCKALDALKMERAIDLGYKYLAIRADEPYDDLDYLRRRLRQIGIKPVGQPEPLTGGIFDLFS